LHLDIFEQPEKNEFSRNLLAPSLALVEEELLILSEESATSQESTLILAGENFTKIDTVKV